MENQKEEKSYIFSAISLLLVLIFALSAVFFIPYGFFSPDFSKLLLLFIGIVVFLIFLFIFVLRGQKINLPKHSSLFLAFFIPVLFFTSAFFGKLDFSLSAFGYGNEVGTAGFILLFFTIFLLSLIIFQNKIHTGLFYRLFLIFFLIASAYQAIKIFAPRDFLSFNLFFYKTSNFLGGWNDLGIYAGASLFLSFLFLVLRRGKNNQFYFFLTFVVSLTVLAVVNFWLPWLLMLIFSVLFLLVGHLGLKEFFRAENTYFDKGKGRRQFSDSYYILAIVLMSLLFLLPTGGMIKEVLYNYLDISFLEVSPSWLGSFHVTLSTLTENFYQTFFGSGPNSFSFQWRLFKPVEVNMTPFWNSDFNYGAGLIPTFFVTTGILGGISFLMFLFSFLASGLKRLFNRNKTAGFLTVSSFFMALYFWMVIIFYTPSLSIILFAPMFAGIFLASLLREKEISSFDVTFFQKKVTAATILFLIGANVCLGFFIYQRSVSNFYFNRAVQLAGQNNLALAETELLKAVKAFNSDVYRKSLAEIYLIEADKLITISESPSPEDIEKLEKLTVNALGNAQLARDFNPINYTNRIFLGGVFEFFTPLGVEGLYENSKGSYQKARELDPLNPQADLLLSRLELSVENLESAKQFAESALTKKPDHIETLFLLSRIASLRGNLEDAVLSAERLVSLNPSDPASHFYLGMLYYQKREYEVAARSFRQAVSIEPVYANARYFLGLSLAKLRFFEEAIRHFEVISENHPDNQEVQSILENLKLERDPFDTLSVSPEERDVLPLDEE